MVGILSFIFKDKKGPVLIDERMTGKQYREKVIEKEVLPTAMEIEYNSGSWAYMHDGAPCHRVKIAQNFFEEEGITLIDWPALFS